MRNADLGEYLADVAAGLLLVNPTPSQQARCQALLDAGGDTYIRASRVLDTHGRLDDLINNLPGYER